MVDCSTSTDVYRDHLTRLGRAVNEFSVILNKIIFSVKTFLKIGIVLFLNVLYENVQRKKVKGSQSFCLTLTHAALIGVLLSRGLIAFFGS